MPHRTTHHAAAAEGVLCARAGALPLPLPRDAVLAGDWSSVSVMVCRVMICVSGGGVPCGSGDDGLRCRFELYDLSLLAMCDLCTGT